MTLLLLMYICGFTTSVLISEFEYHLYNVECTRVDYCYIIVYSLLGWYVMIPWIVIDNLWKYKRKG